MFRLLWLPCLCLLWCAPAQAEALARFGPFEPNYAIFQRTSDDDASVETHYSFRYSFTDPINPLRSRPELLFTYTGEFDFYALGGRESAPVINRISQPALRLRLRAGPWPAWMRWVGLALVHRSNGQVLDADERLPEDDPANPGRLRTELEHAAGNEEYFDALSRSANYFRGEFRFRVGQPVRYDGQGRATYPLLGFDLWVSAKVYASTSSDVTWGRFAGRGVDISDYDRGRVILSKRYTFARRHFRIHGAGVGIDWRVGDNGLYGDSLRIGLLLPLETYKGFRLPIFARFHTGPLSTLSNYTKRQRSFGVGLRFQ